MEPTTCRFSWKSACALVATAVFSLTGVARAADGAGTTNELTTVGQLNAARRPQGVPLDYVITPDGFFSPACVQQVRKDETVHADGGIETANGAVRRPAACTWPHYRFDGVRVEPNGAATMPPIRTVRDSISGWVEDASFVSFANIGRLDGVWHVPSEPVEKSGQGLMLFTGLSNTAQSFHLHPMISFREKEGWTASSWSGYINGVDYYSTPVSVNVGDLMVSHIECKADTAAGGCDKWSVRIIDIDTNATSELSAIEFGFPLQEAYGGVLQGVSISNCHQFPASSPVSFSSITLVGTDHNVVNPVWRREIPWNSTDVAPKCGYNVSANGGIVNLSY
jgi:hypothetical protein